MKVRLALLTIVFTCIFFPSAFGVQEPDENDPNITVPHELLKGLEYRSIGPSRGGRSTAGVGVPGEPHTFYMGTTGGGVWKTVDAGENWSNISDGFFGAGSIGAIAVAESDTNVVYVGTGSNAPRGNISAGDGVYKSTDSGGTWSHIGLKQAGQISRIRIHPSNPDLVYTAVLGNIFGPGEERGIFRSKDGGANWEKVLYISDRTGAVDLTMDVSNPRILYAAVWTAERKPWTLISGSEEGGIYKTIDGGDTWEKLKGGLPEGIVGKIGVAVSPANPSRIWALVEAEEGGVFRSDNAGKTWTRVNQNRNLRQRAWYYTRIFADPVDPDTVYALNTGFYKSIDGGKTFNSIRVLHGDCHDLWINPQNPQIMIQTNDGGAHVTLTGGESWSTLYNQPTAEIYRLTVDNQFPYRVYGAQQDNSTISVPSRNPGGLTPYENWYDVGGCESGHIAVDPRNPDIVYAGCYGGYISKTNLKTQESQNILVYPQLQLGQAPSSLRYRFQWNAPIRLSPHNPDVLYHTSQIVHRSADGGHSWEDISPDLTRNDKSKQDYAGEPITRDNTGVEVYGTVFAFEESPFEAGVLWAGSDDGLVHISKDSGKNWTNITPKEVPEFSTVNMIELSPHGKGRAFLAVQGYRLNDFKPYVYRTNDEGKTWDLLTDGENGIPKNHFVRVVREDPDREGLLYAGTEYGLYVSFNDGKNWQSLQLNLPRTPITDLVVHEHNLVVATQGRSFWILDDLNILHEAKSEITGVEVHLYKPGKVYRASFSSGRGGGSRAGSSPPNGAVLHYYLQDKPEEEELKIDFIDSSGKVLKSFSSKAEKEEEGSEGSSAPAEKGLNKLVWDLRLESVTKVKDAVVWGFTGGPVVQPGRYSARLSLGETSQSVSFEVLADPRSESTPTELAEQFQFMLEIREKLNQLYAKVREIRSIREQVSRISREVEEAGMGSDLKGSADTIAEKLSQIEGRLMQTKNESNQDPLNFPPMLDNQFAYLYGYVGSTNARPTEGSRKRYSDLDKELGELLGELQTIVDSDVANFATEVKKMDLPTILVPKSQE
jgi:photosystem II stability/assembly factor-like uncharacterized protein